jgi:hypothetical protein
VAGNKSTIATLKGKTEGFDKVRKDLDSTGKATDRIGKAQTRLGQTSASSGRQFSAQAAGLGGLVGAYAGAAANIFAITAAFTALNRAARAEQTIDGLNRLAATFGQVGSEVLDSLQRITKGQLSLAETAQQANIALSAGLGPQLEGLTAVSLKASRALGRNLTDAFQRVVRGAGKLEPELLDELGIFARIDPAVEKYALQTGKTASSLTNFERRQAFANAVLEEGARKFATVNTTVPTTAEKLEKLGATIANIGQQLGAFLADYLAPVADFISNNMSAAVLAIGLLLRQLFGRALASAATGFDSFINRVSGRLANLSLNAQTTNQAFQQATSGIAKKASSINPGTLFGGKQAQEGAKVLRFLREGGTISPADAKRSAAALREAAAAQTKFAKSAEGADDRAKKQQRSLNALAKQVDGLTAATNRYGLIATKAFNLVNAAALGLKATISSVLGFGSKLLVVIGIVEALAAIAGQIFDKNLSPIGFLASLISDANQESKKFAATLGEITVEISKVVNTAGLLPEQIAEAAADSAKDLKRVFDPSFLAEPLTAAFRTLDNLAVPEIATGSRSRASLKRLQAGIENLKESVSEFGIEGRKAFVELQIAEEIEKVLKAFGRSGDSAFRLLSRVANQTGIDGAQLFKIFQDGIVTVNQDTKNFEATIAGLTFSFADLEGKFLNFGGEAGATLLAVEANLRSFTEEFERGSLNAEEAGKRIVALETQLGRVSATINAALLQDISTITTEDIKRLDTQKLILAELEKQLKPYNDIKDSLVTLEKLQKDLKSTLSSDIKEFEKAALTGLTGPFGFAEDQLTATKNQLAFQNKLLDTSVAELDNRKAITDQLEDDLAPLKNRKKLIEAQLESNARIYANAIARGVKEKELNDILKNTEELQRVQGNLSQEISELQSDIASKTAIIQTREAIIRDITAARLGSILKLSDETTKLARTQQRAADAAKAELDILILRNQLNERNRQLREATAADTGYIEELSRELQINEALSKLSNAQNELAIRKRQIEQQTTEAVLKQSEASREILKIRGDIAKQKIEKDFAAKLAPLAKDLKEAEFFSNLYTEEQRRKIREKIIILERDQQLAILKEKKRQADEEYRLNLDIVNARIAGAENAIKAAKDDAAALDKRQRTELSLFDQRKDLERQQAQRQINRIQDQREVFTLEERIANTQAKAQLDRKIEGIEQTRRELSVIEEQARVNDAFINSQGKIVEKYAEIVNAQLREAGFEDQQILVNVDDFKTASADTIARLAGIRDNLQLQQNRAEDYYSEQLRESTAIKESREALNSLEEERLQRDLDGAAKLAEIERSILLSKQKLATAESQATIENAKRSLEALQGQKTQLLANKKLTDDTYQNERNQIIQNAKDKLDVLARERAATLRLVNDLVGALNDGVGKALETIFDNIAEGKKVGEGLRDVLFETFENIRKTILRQTLIEPIQNFISESVGSFFGIEQRGADNAAIVQSSKGPALLVSLTDSVSSVGGIEDTIGALNTAQQKQAEVANTAAEATEQQKGFFATIIDGFKAAGTGVVDFFGSIFSALSGSGGGGGIGSFFSGIFGQGGLNFGQLFGGPSNAMLATGAATHSAALQMQADIASGSAYLDPGMFAAGGLVKRFAGGGNVNYQDRVPALLQPGEFVMKKSAVKAMGAGNMAMMNATGSGGNVVVNITNEGTPQEATASQPMFDGEKYVIDIVTRDLRNNGPIRKSLRGGAA